MAFPQPYFHGLHIKATWDGEINHALDLLINLDIKALPNSRLRLISLDVPCHAEMTGMNEHPPGTTRASCASPFQVEEDREVEQAKVCTTPSAITELNLDAPSTNHVSRIPLPISSQGSSPQKRPIPIAQRSPWRPPASGDVREFRGRSSKIGESKSMTSHSADGSCSPTKSLGKNFRIFDPTPRGREPLRTGVSRRASHSDLSGHTTTDGTPEQKVTEWLEQNHHEPKFARARIPGYDAEDCRSEERLDSPSAINTAEEHDTFPPSPSPSSQASVPWASAIYRNPLRLRGAGSCAASIEKRNGCFYAVFPTDVTEVVHHVQIQARVFLRKDSDSNGHFLEIPGLPIQDMSEGCFSLLITGDDEYGCPNYLKVAHIDKNSQTKVLTGSQFEAAFNVGAPFSFKLLRFDLDGVQELKETEFEIDCDVQTSSNRHLIVCWFRLRHFLFWANHVRIKIFVSSGPFEVIRAEPVNGADQIPIVDQCKGCPEREVTVTMKAAELTMPLVLICENATGSDHTWAPRISRSRRLAEDVSTQRQNIRAVHADVVEMFRRPKLEISKITNTHLNVSDTPISEESAARVVQISPLRAAGACFRSLWHVIEFLSIAYFIGYFVTTEFKLDSKSFKQAEGKIINCVYSSYTELASNLSGRSPLWHKRGVGKEILQQIGEESREWDEAPQQIDEHIAVQDGTTPQQIGEDSAEQDEATPQQVHENIGGKEDEIEAGEPEPEPELATPLGLTLRDKIDRALGWKGPVGDW